MCNAEIFWKVRSLWELKLLNAGHNLLLVPLVVLKETGLEVRQAVLDFERSAFFRTTHVLYDLALEARWGFVCMSHHSFIHSFTHLFRQDCKKAKVNAYQSHAPD